YTVFEGVVSIMRDEGFVSNLDMKIEDGIPAYSTYYPLLTQILSYNSFKMPEKTRSVKEKIMPVNDLLEFEYEYVKAADIPMKLKRLVNEELLYLNRYGVTNYDLLTLTENKSLYILLSGKDLKSGWGSTYGEGNWLVSFGLPQYHILE